MMWKQRFNKGKMRCMFWWWAVFPHLSTTSKDLQSPVCEMFLWICLYEWSSVSLQQLQTSDKLFLSVCWAEPPIQLWWSGLDKPLKTNNALARKHRVWLLLLTLEDFQLIDQINNISWWLQLSFTFVCRKVFNPLNLSTLCSYTLLH